MPTDGKVGALWRYPVKSMLGEELASVRVAASGLIGDRAFGLIDRETGRVVSAKHLRKWPQILACSASALEDRNGVRAVITLPYGRRVTTDADDASAILSEALGREVALASTAPDGLQLEYQWPDLAGLPIRDQLRSHATAEGLFFDGAVIHLLTSSSLARLGELCGSSVLDARRFRPNVVLHLVDSSPGFVENDWVGTVVSIGDCVRIRIDEQCMRCSMVTAAQQELAQDIGILRALVEHNQCNLGVRGAVLAGGTMRVGDQVRVES